MNEVEHVLAVQNGLGEGPQWNPEERMLYWVNIIADQFHRWSPLSDRYDTFDVGLPVGALVFRASGGLVLATRDGFAFWDFATKKPTFFADPEAGKAARFNDGKVDRQGRFWAGTMADDGSLTSALYRLDPDLSVHTMVTGVGISNGLGWSPDNKTMYYTDSPKRTIVAYDYDLATGAVANERVFVSTPGTEDVPDGLTVDSEGFVWSARWDGWRVVRYDPDGKVEREVRVPAARVTSCVFGGADLDELYITTARQGLSAAQLKEQPFAGDIFRLKAGVKGLPEPKFAG